MLDKSILEKLNRSEPFYVKGAMDPSIFSWKELEFLLNLRPFVNYKRFHIINDREYSWHNPGWSSDNSFPASLINQEISRYVCYLSDCSRANEKINAVCKTIEDYTDSEVDAHLYFSLYFDDLSIDKFIHKDKSNNLIMQIDGKTNFKIFNKLDPSKLEYDIVMEPGDILYIPADIYHGALSLTKRLSISFPMSPHAVQLKEDRFWIKL
jgi:hypothetical protein